MHRAVVINGFNEKDPDSSLQLVTKPLPTAEPGQVVVHLTLRPVNPTDIVAIRTGRTARGIVGPATPGSEGFGIVHAVSQLPATKNFFAFCLNLVCIYSAFFIKANFSFEGRFQR